LEYLAWVDRHNNPATVTTSRQAASLRSKDQLALAGLVEGRR
jgi:hypothetical protein